MMRAAVLPYVRPRAAGPKDTGPRGVAGAVVALPGAGVVHIPLGRVRCLDHSREGCEVCREKPREWVDVPGGGRRERLHFARVIDDDELREAVARIASACRERGVQLVAIEAPRGESYEAEQGRRVAAALAMALDGIATVAFAEQGAAREVDARLRVLLEQDSNNIALPPLMPMPAASAPNEAHVEPAAPATPAPVPVDAGLVLAPPGGPRVAGIDPGSRYVAITIGEGAAAPLRHVASVVIDVGRLSPKGKAYKLTDHDMDTLLRRVSAVLAEHHVTRAAVERVSFLSVGGSQTAKSSAGVAAWLLRAQWVGGEIAGALRAAGVAVESTSSKEWRGHVRKLAGSSPWRDAVRFAFAGTMPQAVNEHALDAGGVAVWAVRPRSEPRGELAARAPGEKRKRANPKRKADQAAKRSAAGCHCGGRQHAPACPIAIAANEARKGKMAGNRNAAR
jgi:hypothetical protein